MRILALPLLLVAVASCAHDRATASSPGHQFAGPGNGVQPGTPRPGDLTPSFEHPAAPPPATAQSLPAAPPPLPPAVSREPAQLPCPSTATPPLPPLPAWFPLPVAAPPAASPCTPDIGIMASAPPTPQGPPADLDGRLQEVRMSLGQNAKVQVVTDLFIVASPAGYAAFPSTVALATKAAEAYFHDRIRTRPRGSIPVYVFGTTSSYDSFCVATEGTRCASPLGFYDPMRRHVVVNAQNGLGSLTHEMMHPLIESDFPGAPDWFDEGVASLYGKAVFPSPGEVHGATNWRLLELKRALASARDAEASMSRLFGMSSDEFRDARQGLHYAMARYFCQWLDAQDRLWPFYHTWRDNLVNDPTGARSFQQVTGQTPDQANTAWVTWVKALQAGS